MAEETNIPDDGVNELSQKSPFIAPASIGMTEYKPITPPVLDIHDLNLKSNIDNPALRVKDTTTGSAPYHPKKVDSGDAPKFGGLDGIFAKTKAQLVQNVDNKVYNKIYAYDSSPKGAHKARYKAYGQETYDKIGFSPEIDNETWFNANTTMYDDWKRMATNAAWPMMKLGFMSPIKSYGKLFGQADIGQDLAEARDYEEYNAIGYSTKGGIGGFAINLQNSAAYSVGIITESVVEGALIGAAVGAVAGEGIGAAPGAALGGIFEGISAIGRLPKTLYQMSKNLGKMTMNLKKLQNLSEVKNVFANAGRTMGNFVNPFTNTTEAAMKYVFKNPDDLTNLARTARTAGAMWHDVKNINAALSEGRLEGGFTEQRVYDDLYNKYYDKYGVAPTDELQKDMRKQAKVAGFQNTWKNTLLVNYSNKIAFPSITRAGFMKGLPTFSKTFGTVGPYQLIYDPAKKVAKEAYRIEKVSLKNAAKSLVKPSTYGKTALNYFKANLVEGFQETAQDVLSNATEEYYINSFKNKDRQNFDYSMATLGSALKKQISAQGAETFASGFAMGTILGIPGGVKEYLSVGYNKYFKNRANYDQYVAEREGEAQSIVDALNTMDKNAKHFFDPRLNNYVNQMLVGKVADDPDNVSPKEAKDASFAGFKSAVRTALRTGTFDMFIDNFQGYKQASPEDIEAAWSLEPGQGTKALEYIDSATKTAKDIASRWQFSKNKFKEVVNPNQFAEGTPERQMADIYNEAYLTGLDNLVFMGSAFDNNSERLSKMYTKLSSLSAIQNSRFSNFANIVEPEKLQKEIAMLRTDVELGKNATTPEAKEQYQKQKDLLEKLENYQTQQFGATVQFLKKLRDTQKSIMESEEGISANEAQQKALDQVVEEYDEQGLNSFEDYKNSYRDLLDTLAGSEEDKVKLNRELDDAGGFDEFFQMLMDSYLLRNENVNLNKFINLLNDPKGFYDHVQRNFDWMKKLYDNRQDYYTDVVNNSMLAIQRNSLLEELAEKGIYVDLEEFAEWTEDNNNLPTYFIDQVNNRIINQDSYLYDQYIQLFVDASQIDSKNPPVKKSDKDQKLQKIIDDYNIQRDGELETVKNTYDRTLKELVGYTQEEIDEMISQATAESEMSEDDVKDEVKLIEKALKQLDSNNVVEIQAVFDIAVDKNMFTAQEYNLKKEDIFSDDALLEEMQAISERFTDVDEVEAQDAAANVMILKPLLESRLEVLNTYDQTKGLEGIPQYEDTKPYADYTKAVDEINKKYDNLIDEAEGRLAAETRADVEAKRPEAMKKTIKQIKDLIDTKEDIVQTKRNYIVDGELHDRMSNRIKTGYDTYGYSGEADLIEVYDSTIGAALAGKKVTTTPSDIEAKKAEIETYGIKYFLAQILGTPIQNLEKGKKYIRVIRSSEQIPTKIEIVTGTGETFQTQLASGFSGAGSTKMAKVTLPSFYDSEGVLVNAGIPESLGTFYNIPNFNLNNKNEIASLLKQSNYLTRSPKFAEVGYKNLDDGTFTLKYYDLNFNVKEARLEIESSISKDIKDFIEKEYDKELAALEEPIVKTTVEPTVEVITPGVLTQKVIDDFIKELVDADLPGVNTNKFTVDTVRDELETLIAPEGTRLTKKTQKQIDDLKSQLSTIESKLASVKDKKRLATLEKQKKRLEEAIKDEETGKYREPFEMTNDNIKSFVLNTVKENAFEESRDAGNILDPMLKDFLDTETSKKPVYDPELMSKEAYDNLFDDETGYLTKFKEMADAGEIYIFTKNLYVHSNNLVDENGKKLPPVAGEIDMIIVDRKGRAFIVDLKTGKVAKWLNYKTRGTKSFEKQIENTMQQTGYFNLLENEGVTVDGIMIFPLELGFDSKGFIKSANAPTNPSLFAGEEVIGDEGTLPYTIQLDKGNNTQIKNEETGQYENISIDQFMQRLIPVKGRKASQIKTKPVPTEAIPEEERAIADEFMLKMANAKEFDDLTEVALELDEMKPNLSKETYNMLKYQLDTRMSMDLNIPDDIILNTDEIYIFTQPVKALKITEGYRVKIDMLDPETQTVVISRVGPGRTRSIEMSIKDFTENTMTEEQLNNLPKEEPTYEPSQEEIDMLNESLDATNEGLSEFEKLAQLEADAYAEGVTLDSLENNFLNNIKC